jgi:Tol biopolymer transport system component
MRRSGAAIVLVGLLALTPGAGRGRPSRAANGKIVYITRVNAAGIGAALVTRDPDGGGRAVLRRSAYCLGNPAFSPDGGSLAFETCDGLATMRANGSGFNQLARFSQPEVPSPLAYARDATPAWSPGGRRLVFAAVSGYGRPGGAPYRTLDTRIRIVRADGPADARSRLPAGVVAERQAARLLQDSVHAGRLSPAIYTIRLDGGERRFVTRARRSLPALDRQPVR